MHTTLAAPDLGGVVAVPAEMRENTDRQVNPRDRRIGPSEGAWIVRRQNTTSLFEGGRARRRSEGSHWRETQKP